MVLQDHRPHPGKRINTSEDNKISSDVTILWFPSDTDYFLFFPYSSLTSCVPSSDSFLITLCHFHRLSLPLSFSTSLCLCLYPHLSISISLSHCFFLFLSLSLHSLSLSLSLFLSLSLSFSLSLTLSLSISYLYPLFPWLSAPVPVLPWLITLNSFLWNRNFEI